MPRPRVAAGDCVGVSEGVCARGAVGGASITRAGGGDGGRAHGHTAVAEVVVGWLGIGVFLEDGGAVVVFVEGWILGHGLGLVSLQRRESVVTYFEFTCAKVGHAGVSLTQGIVKTCGL